MARSGEQESALGELDRALFARLPSSEMSELIYCLQEASTENLPTPSLDRSLSDSPTELFHVSEQAQGRERHLKELMCLQ